MTQEKTIFIIEGSDGTGKSSLCKFIQNYVNGKCHTIHSNFDKSLPKQNHFRQHTLITKFVKKQFDKKHYTGNSVVILDRNYISDIIYGDISYGSKGDKEYKLNKLQKMLKTLNKTANVVIVHCNPENNKYSETLNEREELLNSTENNTIETKYKQFFSSFDFYDILENTGSSFYEFNFDTDSDYKDFVSHCLISHGVFKR